MEVFVRVAECGSFSRAAESLDLANATVTTCVRNLERHLDVTLINRDTRRLRLTEEGQTFLLRARELLEAVSRTEDEIRSQVGQLRGRLHVEMPISLGHALLCPALPEFAKRYPEISTALTLTNQRHHVIERGIDLAIRMDQVEDADLIARPIYEGRYVVCCAPELVASLPAHPGDLDRRKCIGILPEERRFVNPWPLKKGEEEIEIRPDGPLHYNSSDALLIAAERGVGVTCVLDVFVNRQLADGTLVQVYPEWDTAVKTFYVVMAKSRVGSAKVKAFTDFLFEVFASQRRPSGRSVVSVRAIGSR
ncbi:MULTISPECIES: LysR family transcriptional regulator [unclassified Variovorax]|jgi:LysR family transcriptional regulator for bpeEF and oprC|uniref:LysR family transcriptional regulator n=1 Tax=unclassified Variovorax TaxID=663243 RepID=UPI00076CED24|nr:MULTISPECIES: LysR family transcriptional regulator [unclassified Variovorax]KWT97046.1 Transcriptional regulator, LysR family [Variovorax sp. WDL1]PNG47047.1 HTH-type transcriptional regulator DmlR [Variovorax sp. B2]PNG48302.1 HTH-type transcriptional regulator DmlR [Variovorax sp. B4]VTV14904.1 D-malate degradation protein R [Variovorax sp. WDL1]